MTVEIYQLGPDVWEHRVFTTAPPCGVFDYIVDFERHIEWEHELLTVKPCDGKTAMAGARYLKTYGTRPTGLVDRFFNRGHRVTCKLGEVQRPQRIVWKQYRSHDASGPSSFQGLDLIVTPRGSGSLIVLTRRFSGIEGSGADMVARFASRWGPVLQGLPPEVRAAAGRPADDRPGLFSSPEDVIRHALDGHPSHGPGPTSLERLKAILDGDGQRHTRPR
jgi:hypothetical protein